MRDLLPRFVVLGRNSIAPGYVFDLEAPLVVIFGPTGSGKSVLLSCLRYALGGPEPEDAKARDAWVICQPREPSDAHLIYDALVGPAFERRLHVAVGEVVRRWIVMRSEVPPVYGSISEDDEPIGSPLDEARLSNEMPDDPPPTRMNKSQTSIGGLEQLFEVQLRECRYPSWPARQSRPALWRYPVLTREVRLPGMSHWRYLFTVPIR